MFFMKGDMDSLAFGGGWYVKTKSCKCQTLH